MKQLYYNTYFKHIKILQLSFTKNAVYLLTGRPLVQCTRAPIRVVCERFTKGEADCEEAANFSEAAHPPRAATNLPQLTPGHLAGQARGRRGQKGARPRPAAAGNFRAKPSAAPLPGNRPGQGTSPGGRRPGTSDPRPKAARERPGLGNAQGHVEAGQQTPGPPEPHLSAAESRGPRHDPLRRCASGARPDR